MANTFPKPEHLCGKIRIAQVYQTGRKFTVWPLRVTYTLSEQPQPVQVLVWAPKSSFKHAVDRNRLRRLMREAYRLNKDLLAESHIQNLCINYIDKDLHAYGTIAKSMQKALVRLSRL